MDENIDFSKAFEQLQEMLSSDSGQAQIQDLLGMFGQGSETASSANPFEGSGIDLDMLGKISGIMQAMNTQNNNQKAAFLNSLKPFLGESRRKKLDQAAKIVKMASVFKAFKENSEGGA